MKGGSMLWTEDWMPDSASHRWSYYSARMRSAIALSNYSEGMSFSGYIVTRSSGGQEGGLLQRPLTMVTFWTEIPDDFRRFVDEVWRF